VPIVAIIAIMKYHTTYRYNQRVDAILYSGDVTTTIGYYLLHRLISD
jgi:hypothetical protein